MNKNIEPVPPNLIIAEQTIIGDASGLTFQFMVNEKSIDSPYKLIIFGASLPFGNREILFGKDGIKNGGGTFVGGACDIFES